MVASLFFFGLETACLTFVYDHCGLFLSTFGFPSPVSVYISWMASIRVGISQRPFFLARPWDELLEDAHHSNNGESPPSYHSHLE